MALFLFNGDLRPGSVKQEPIIPPKDQDKASSLECPEGFIPIAGNAHLGTSDFCVMQFEARKDFLGQVVSNAMDSVYLMVSFEQAIEACEGMESNLGGAFQLITNPQWMTIAHEIEQKAENWSTGIVDEGCLKAGHIGRNNDCSYQVPIRAEIGDNRPDLARHILSSGDSIWDLGGNVYEYIQWSEDQRYPPVCENLSQSEWVDLDQVQCTGLDISDFLPLTNQLEEGRYIGRFFAGTENIVGGTKRVAVRSGDWAVWEQGGIYQLNFAIGNNVPNTNVGFRCSWRP
jgi:hypothetical protein